MSASAPPDWPPPHTTRVSRRARRVSLRFHPEKGLEIVSPSRLTAAHVAELLDTHRAWIERHLPLRRVWPPGQLPLSIALPAIEQDWRVEHVAQAPRARLRACPDTQVVTFHGDGAAFWPLLNRWLTAQAKARLLPRLHALALEHGCALEGATIRWSRTRWGSCSRRGAISLSARLLWLAPAEVHYVMLHELTHLEHFHHGPDFWHALERRLPGARLIDARLRHAGRQLPAWLPLLK